MNMEKIHHDSGDCVHSELELFTLPPTGGQVEKCSYITCQPLCSTEGDAPLEFISKGTSDYVDLSKMLLYMKVCIVNEDGTDITLARGENDQEIKRDIAPVNYIAHSLFSQMDVYFNEQMVSTPHTLHPYRAYMECLLNHSKESQKSQLATSLFYADTPGKMEVLGAENAGYETRKTKMHHSNRVELLSWLHGDFFNQDRFLLNNVDLRIRLTRSSPNFYLLTDVVGKSYKIKIEKAALYLRKVKVADSLLLAHAQMLTQKTAKYPLNRVDMRMFSISPQVTTFSKDNVFPNQIPRRVIIGLVDAAALNGNLKKNPFNFQHFNVNFAALYVDDMTFPSPPFTPDFDNERSIRCYQSLLDNMGIWRTDKGFPIDRWDFNKGYTLFAFDLSPDGKHCMDYFGLIRQGNVRLEIKFAQPLSSAVAVVMYAEFENLLEINAHGKVNYDYSS